MRERYRVKIVGTGREIPEKQVTNEDLSKVLETSDDWIIQRTGIKTRYKAEPGTSNSQMAARAARKAMETAGLGPQDIDLVLFATVTPDYRLPFNAALLQRDLELPNASGFDISSGCAGFVQASQAASTFIQSGAARTALVVGSEMMSAIIDPEDRSTAVIFGDGAGAVIFQRADENCSSELLAVSGGLQGDEENLIIPDGGSRCPVSQKSIDERRTYVRMNGRNIFRFAVDRFTTQIESCCKTAGVDPRDIRLVIPHQVNQRIIESAVRRLDVPMERVVINLDRLGNTASATIPIALDEAIRDGRIERDELLIMVSFGAGLAWAAALYRY